MENINKEEMLLNNTPIEHIFYTIKYLISINTKDYEDMYDVLFDLERLEDIEETLNELQIQIHMKGIQQILKTLIDNIEKNEPIEDESDDMLRFLNNIKFQRIGDNVYCYYKDIKLKTDIIKTYQQYHDVNDVMEELKEEYQELKSNRN